MGLKPSSRIVVMKNELTATMHISPTQIRPQKRCVASPFLRQSTKAPSTSASVAATRCTQMAGVISARRARRLSMACIQNCGHATMSLRGLVGQSDFDADRKLCAPIALTQIKAATKRSSITH